ncbi:hypothetical protein [Streptomyces sp. NPDC002156]
MLSAFLGQTPGLLDRRFLLHSFLPSLAFCTATIALLAGSPPGVTQTIRTWQALSPTARAGAVLTLLALAGVLAGILSGFRRATCRFFGGHWTGPAAAYAARHGVAWHQRRSRLLHQAPAFRDAALISYPPPTRPEEIQPTRLGNILRSAEQYPQLRYSMDAVLAWPRLYQVLPDRLTLNLAAARADLDAALGLSVLCILFGGVGAAEMLWEQGPWTWFLAFWWGGAFAAYVSYRSALTAAQVYAQHVRVAFDLHRGDLIRQLGDELPSSIAEERDYWYRLSQFWHRGIPREHLTAFTAPPPAASTTPAPPTRLCIPLTAWLGMPAALLGVAGAFALAR